MSVQLPISFARLGSFEAYLSYANSLPVIGKEQERILFKRYQDENDLDAVQQIVLSHLRFVAYIAKSYKGYGLPMEDLVQEGTVGLMKSVKKFSLALNVRLSSFAIHYIKAEIQEFVIRNWRLVKAATTKAKRKLFFNLRRLRPSTEWLANKDKKQIAKELGVNESDINEMEVQLSQADVYIDSDRETGDDIHLSTNADVLLEDHSETFTSTVIKKDYQEKALYTIREAVDDLDDRTKDIIQQRWFSEKQKTQKHFAQKYGVSQERIRQIEEKALLNIRKKLMSLEC